MSIRILNFPSSPSPKPFLAIINNMKHKKPKTIFELLDYDQFRKRMAMYIGEKSISKLGLFMLGYEMCEKLNEIKSTDTKPPFWLFFQWICKYYNHSGSYYSWDGIILQNCGNDEAKALDTFFERFDEFRTYKPIKIISAKITDSELNFFHSHDGIIPLKQLFGIVIMVW
ncbi:MAG: hypothetical protein IPL35_02495 [Sphingobacteriales bacterium]|nr:hypothetical protein [Sphingobacteriales bacterium]